MFKRNVEYYVVILYEQTCHIKQTLVLSKLSKCTFTEPYKIQIHHVLSCKACDRGIIRQQQWLAAQRFLLTGDRV